MNKDMEFVLKVFKEYGRNVAESFEQRAASMTDDEIVENQQFYPSFNPDKQYLNYSSGYICISPSGNVVKLLQPYNSTIYTQDPEDLPAQWGFLWPTNPKYAKPFVALSTSPYMENDCCTYNGHVYRSGMNNNVWPPGTTGISWEDLGSVEDLQS